MFKPNRSLYVLVYAAALCIAVEAGAAQQKDTPDMPPAAGSAATTGADAAQLEVAPGIPVPPYGMVWILDQPQGTAQLRRIFLNHIHPNGHRAENAVKAQFLVLRMGSSIELPGATAKLRIATHAPVIFIRKSQEEEEEIQSSTNVKNVMEHFALLRLRADGDRRIVCTFTAWEFGLKLARHEDVVKASMEEFAAGQWLKITPAQPLADGEYAVMHLPDDKGYVESNVYDFGVGAAPASPAGK
jgi:hypothetical protein